MGLFIISLWGLVSSRLLPFIFEEETFAALSAPGRKVTYKGSRGNERALSCAKVTQLCYHLFPKHVGTELFP